MTEKPLRPGLSHLTLLLLMMGCGIAAVGQIYLFNPLLPDVVLRYRVSLSQASLASSVFGFFYASGFILVSVVSTRLGENRLLITGLVGAAILALATALAAPHFAIFLALRALSGLAASATVLAASVVLIERLPPRAHPVALGMMSMAFLGSAPLVQLAVSPFDTAAAMSGAAVFSLVLAIGILLTVGWRRTAEKVADNRTRPALSSVFGDRVLWLVWACAGTLLYPYVAFQAGLAVSQFTPQPDLALLRLALLPGLAMTFASPALVARFGHARSAAIGFAIIALAMIGAATQTPIGLLMGALLLTSGVATATPALLGIVIIRTTAQDRAPALAIYSLVLFMGASVAPLVAQSFAPSHFPVLCGLLVLLTLVAGLVVAIWGRQPPP
jgi:YNFM family putative membrane transporter